jgi:hypothetical protein
MSNDLATYDHDGEIEIFSPASVFDVERFDQIMRVADVMARATTLPDHLKSNSQDPDVRFEETRGNCFMICNQSSHWGMDPFAVAQATAFVYGKFCYEGKLIRAVIRKFLGFDLKYAFFGKLHDMERTVYVSDQELSKQGDNGQAVPLTQEEIEDLRNQPGRKITVGTLQKWHTKAKGGGVNDNWVKDEDKMFRERGSREWCRQWAPGLMLGVYTTDEFDDVENSSRSNRARDVSAPSNPLLENKPAVPMDRIDPHTGEVISENSGAQAERTDKKTSQRPSGGEPQASAKPAHQAGRPTDSSRESEQSGSNSSSASQADGNAGGDEPRRPSSVFQEYSQMLLRYSSVENVEKAHNSFWEGHGGKPANPDDVNLTKVILRIHNDRVKNGVTPEQARNEAAAKISESFEL